MEGRTDMTELLVAFRNFAHALKNCTAIQNVCYTTYQLTVISTCYTGRTNSR